MHTFIWQHKGTESRCDVQRCCCWAAGDLEALYTLRPTPASVTWPGGVERFLVTVKYVVSLYGLVITRLAVRFRAQFANRVELIVYCRLVLIPTNARKQYKRAVGSDKPAARVRSLLHIQSAGFSYSSCPADKQAQEVKLSFWLFAKRKFLFDMYI